MAYLALVNYHDDIYQERHHRQLFCATRRQLELLRGPTTSSAWRLQRYGRFSAMIYAMFAADSRWTASHHRDISLIES